MKNAYMEKLTALCAAAKSRYPALRGKLRNVLPLCALTLALTLTAAMADMTDSLVPASPGSDGTAAESSLTRAVDFSGTAMLLTAEGYRVERNRMLLSGAEDDSFLFEARQEQLAADGYREERLAVLRTEEAAEALAVPFFVTDAEEEAAAEQQVALVDDTLYAYAPEEDRWVVIDSPLSGDASDFNAAENAERIYAFAKEVLGVNNAAACGILSNIRHESGFNPRAVFIEADGRVSYGICQWNAGRLSALREYCTQRGYDPSTLAGQLQYLQYELKYRERAAFYRVKSAPDTANGAYEAGYNWAKYFERCAARYYPARAEMAYSTYWMKYGNANDRFLLSIIGETYPAGTLRQGTPVELCGVIRSDVAITRVSAFVTDANGNTVLSWQQDWNRVRYDIEKDGLNKGLSFGSLPNGQYTYTVYAADATGASRTLIQSAFTVTGSAVPDTIPVITQAETPETVPDVQESPVTEPASPEAPPVVDALAPQEGTEAAAPEAPLPEPAVPEDTAAPEPVPEAPSSENPVQTPQTGGTVSPAPVPEQPEPQEDGETPENEWLPPDDPNHPGTPAPEPPVPEEPEAVPEPVTEPETPPEEPDSESEWAPPEPYIPPADPEPVEPEPPEEPVEEIPEPEEPVNPEEEWLPPTA